MLVKNEKGFTLLESLLSLAVVVLMAQWLFPLMFHMVIKLETASNEETGMRLLYEELEENFAKINWNSWRKEENIHYRLYWGENEKRKQFACVQTSETKTCLEER
jgi:prepilin-type N-terminal cleavage/methylation domain-containing protein